MLNESPNINKTLCFAEQRNPRGSLHVHCMHSENPIWDCHRSQDITPEGCLGMGGCLGPSKAGRRKKMLWTSNCSWIRAGSKSPSSSSGYRRPSRLQRGFKRQIVSPLPQPHPSSWHRPQNRVPELGNHAFFSQQYIMQAAIQNPQPDGSPEWKQWKEGCCNQGVASGPRGPAQGLEILGWREKAASGAPPPPAGVPWLELGPTRGRTGDQTATIPKAATMPKKCQVCKKKTQPISNPLSHF